MKNDRSKGAKDVLIVSLAEGKGKVTVDLGVIKKASLSLRAINHPLRKKLLELIDAKGKTPVTDIYSKLKIEQSVCSQHLAILRRANVVTTRRDGKKIFYSVNGKRISEITALAAKLAQPE
jgi:DNA-binding transcriptional ArsR family regulator